MKSKKTNEALEAKLSRLKHSFVELAQQTDKMGKEIQGWPVEVVEVHGQRFKARRVVSEQVDRTYDDSLRELGRIGREIQDTEVLLHPPRGRPKGRRNVRTKPDDPTMVAALEDWKNSPEPKPGNRKLAFTHCKVKTEEGRKKWMHRFKKFKEKAQCS